MKNKEGGKKANNEVRQSPSCQESLTCYLECYQLEETCIIENQSLTAYSVNAHTRACAHTHVQARTQKRPTIDSYQPPDKVLSSQGYNIFTRGTFLFCLGCGSQGLWSRNTALTSLAARGYLHHKQHPLPPREASCPNLPCALLAASEMQCDFEICSQTIAFLFCWGCSCASPIKLC